MWILKFQYLSSRQAWNSNIIAKPWQAQDAFNIMFWSMQVPTPLKTGQPSSTFILSFALEQLPDASLWPTLCFSRGISDHRQQTCMKDDTNYWYCKYWVQEAEGSEPPNWPDMYTVHHSLQGEDEWALACLPESLRLRSHYCTQTSLRVVLNLPLHI